VCDFIDNRLGLAPTFWYIGMIGGHLATLPLLVLVTMNASPIAALIFLLPLTLFWAWVFLRIIQSSEHYSGSSFWVVCAVLIVGAQMVSNLIGAVVISRTLFSSDKLPLGSPPLVGAPSPGRWGLHSSPPTNSPPPNSAILA